MPLQPGLLHYAGLTPTTTGAPIKIPCTYPDPTSGEIVEGYIRDFKVVTVYEDGGAANVAVVAIVSNKTTGAVCLPYTDQVAVIDEVTR